MSIRTVRLAGVLRNLNKTAPETQLLTAVAVAILILSYASNFFLPNAPYLETITYVALSIAGIAGVVDSAHRARKLTKWAWGRMTGKLFLAALVALTAIVAASFGKHLTYVLTGTELASSTYFAKAVAAIAWPVLFVACLACLVIIVTVLEMLLVSLGWLTLQMGVWLLRVRQKAIDRLLVGSGAARRGVQISTFDSFSYAIRSLGKLLACGTFLIGIEMVINAPWPSVRSLAMTAMARFDYEAGNPCMASDSRYGMRLDDKTWSVLTIIDKKFDHAEIIDCGKEGTNSRSTTSE